MAIEVIPFDASFQDAVRSLAEEILCREYGIHEDLSGQEDLADVAATYAPPDSLFLLALENGLLIATGGVLYISEIDCELRRLYVEAERRRQGVASTLMGELLDFIRTRSYKRILLEVGPEMKDTIKSYGRYGFAPDDRDLPRAGEFLSIRF